MIIEAAYPHSITSGDRTVPKPVMSLKDLHTSLQSLLLDHLGSLLKIQRVEPLFSCNHTLDTPGDRGFSFLLNKVPRQRRERQKVQNHCFGHGCPALREPGSLSVALTLQCQSGDRVKWMSLRGGAEIGERAGRS